MATRHERWISELRTIAESVAPVSSARIAACIVVKNKLVSVGINQRKTDPFQKRFGKNSEAICLHAEINAIKNALRHIHADDLQKATLYVARMKKKSRHSTEFIQGNAKPCKCGCQRAIATFNIKSVYYTLDNEGIEVL